MVALLLLTRCDLSELECAMETDSWPPQQIQDAVTEQEAMFKKKNEEIRNLRENLEDQESKLALRLTFIVQKDTRILELNKMVGKKKAELKSLQSEVEKRELRIAEMEKMLEKKEQTVEGLKNNNRDVLKKNICLQERLHEKEAEKIQAAKEGFELHEKSCQEHLLKVREAEKAVEDLKLVLKEKEARISELEQEDAYKKITASKTKEKFSCLVAEFEKRNTEVAQQAQNFQSQLQAKTAQLNELEATHKITLEVIESMKRQSRDPRLNGTNELIRQIRDLEMVQLRQKNRIEDLEAGLKKGDETVKQLEDCNMSLLAAETDLKMARAEIKNMDKLLADSDVTVQDLAKKIGELKKEKRQIILLSIQRDQLLEELKKNAVKSNEMNASLRINLSEKEFFLHDLTNQMATLRANNEKRIAGLLAEVSKYSNLEAILRERNQMVASLQAKVNNFKEDLKAERDRMSHMVEEKEKLLGVQRMKADCEMKTLQKKLQSLVIELAEERARKSENEAAAKKCLEDSISSLQKSLQEKELSLADMTDQLTTLRKKADVHDQESVNNQKTLDSLNAKLVYMDSFLKSEQNKMDKTVQDKDMLLDILKNSSALEIKTLQQKIQTLEAELDSSIEEKTEAAKTFEARIGDLETQLAEEREKKKEFESQLASLQALDADIEKQNAVMDRKMEEAAVKSKKKKEYILMLQKKLEDLETELFIKNERLIGQEEEIKKFQDEVVALKKKTDDLVERLKIKELSGQEVSKKLQEELAVSQGLVKELEMKMGQADGIRLENEKQLDDLRRLLGQSKSKTWSPSIWTAEKQEVLTDYSAKIVALRMVIADKNVYIRSIEASREELAKLEGINEALAQSQRDLKEKVNEIGHLRRRLANKNEELEALKLQCQSLERLRLPNEPSPFLPTPDSNQRYRKRKRLSNDQTPLRPLPPIPTEEIVNFDATIIIDE